ncbi:hypothetical protein IU479_35540 [Nocardia abscessus]|uniref:hypothetical protein n=1 Tax=Nocardia TaxID=1817 RepID=UPI001892FBF0|nr:MULTISPECIES: hypothetical protein [Nocardia]MBF6223384.1 hypothetical protein [Nocardia abscessus]
MQLAEKTELLKDFECWVKLVDWAAHAENEVERENPAVRAEELARKWRSVAAEDWNALCDQYEQWCARVAAKGTREPCKSCWDVARNGWSPLSA